MAMTMKRKRSNSNISFGSMLSSPQTNTMDIDMSPMTQYQHFQDPTPSHLPSRTRKRFRDNRPSQETIHRTLHDSCLSAHHSLTIQSSTENTLSILFAAQKQQPNHQPSPSTTSISTNIPERPTDAIQQPSLHSFWALPSQHPSAKSTHSPPPANIRHQINCEDCDANLASNDEDSMDVDIMLGDGSNDFGCSGCGKQVCEHCSISNLGADRQCLLCAGKRKWVEGLGWVGRT